MGFRLTVTKGKSEGKEFSFTKSRVRVGRNHDNDLVLYDLNVSRNHFEIVHHDGFYQLRDCGSQNGTKLNEKAAVEARLSDGDRIQIGGLEFEFSGSDTQPRIAMNDSTERAELFAPTSNEQRMTLEELRTHAVSLKRLQQMKGDAVPQTGPMHKPKSPPGMATAKKIKKPIIWATLLRRFAYPVSALLILAAGFIVFKAFYKAKPNDLSAQKFPISAVLESKSYGAGRVDVSTPAQAQFAWLSSAGRTLLSFTAGGVERQGELTIELNGEKIVDVPVTGPPWGSPVEIKLDRKRLRRDAENVVVFRHHPEPGEAPRWGIRDVTLVETPLPEPSRDQAAVHLRIADEAAQNKRIALGNLYVAADNYRRAMLLLEGYDPPPPDHARAEAAMKAAEKELDRILNEGMFLAEKAKKLGNVDQAESTLRELLLYVPKLEDPRRKQIEERMQQLTGQPR